MAEKVVEMKKYLRKSEIFTYSLGLFGLALLTGWVQGYSKTFFIDFAFKGVLEDTARITSIVAGVFFVARILSAVCDIAIGYAVDGTRTKWGKLRPWILFASVPMALTAIFCFVVPPTGNMTGTIIWIYAFYIAFTIIGAMVENPVNCFGAVATPNPKERSDFLSFASICKSIGQSGGMVVLLVIGLIVKAAIGHHDDQTEYTISAIICAVGGIAMVLTIFFNNRERVPYSNERVSIKDAIKVIFTNKNLLMVALTKVTGFGRGVYSAVSIYIAVYLLGDKNMNLGLLLPMGIGTAVGMLVVQRLLKKYDTKRIYIIFCCYGASMLAILFLVSKAIGFNKTLIIPFLILNFFIGLQHGNTNLTPNVMIADCIDEIEWKTGKRVDALCYSGVSLMGKIAAALTDSFGVLLIGWIGYQTSTDPSIAYAPQTDATLNGFLMIYTIIPAVFVVLQMVPIFFYDLVGAKKEKVTRELIERRGVIEE